MPTMLRKDVKLGLSVGGVFVAVLVVYLLVVPSSQQPGDQFSGGEPSPDALRPDASAGPGAQDATASANQPLSTDPFAPDTELASAARPGGAAQQGPDWYRLLYGKPEALLASGASPTTAPSSSGLIVSRPIDAPVSARSQATASVFADPQTPTPLPMRTHIVQSGETLSSISKAAYGSANFYPHILRANPGLDPVKLRPGMTINLPDARDVKPAEAVKPAETARTPEAPVLAASTEAQRPADATSEYKVQSGDSLHAISLRLYGKADRVDRLYELNKQTIGPNPAALKIGMVLKLPDPPLAGTN
jgi:nucleoid-associated protein YgaU